jgi:aspartate/methionine/tyrosine aminotransferase
MGSRQLNEKPSAVAVAMRQPIFARQPAPGKGLPVRDFALAVYFSRWEPLTRHQLTASDCETLALADLLAMADDDDRERWQALQLGYTDPRGALWLRQTIAGGYENAGTDAVLCFAGAQEGIHVAMHALLERDDHAIVVTPNYQSAESIPLGLCAVSGVALDPVRGWALDIEQLAATIRANTKLISINFPNNPTGKILERDRFDALIALCRRHGIWLFSDEVYRLVEREPGMRLPAAVDAYERGISLSVMSKSYGLPGLRVGWVACRDRALLQGMERIKHYLSICNAAPSEVLAQIALKAGDRILSRNRRIAAANIKLLNDFFAAHADLFEWYIPDGGVVGYPRYAGQDGVESLCARLVTRSGVLLLPASIYRSDLLATPGDRFRIGFGRSDLGRGLEAMRAGLDRGDAHASWPI